MTSTTVYVLPKLQVVQVLTIFTIGYILFEYRLEMKWESALDCLRLTQEIDAEGE